MATSDDSVNVVLISGSTRSGSTNTAALRTLAELEIPGVAATLWDRLVDVPAFVPDDDAEPPHSVSALRFLLAWPTPWCSARPSTPGRCQEASRMRSTGRGSGELYRMLAAWINVGNPGRGAGAEAALATVLGYVRRRRRRAGLRPHSGRGGCRPGPDGTVATPTFVHGSRPCSAPWPSTSRLLTYRP